jgi:hypothetical protein
LAGSARSNAIEEHGAWSVVSLNRSLSRDVASQLQIRNTASPVQVRFHLSDINEAKVFDYIRAHTYVRTRHVANANLLLINQLAANLDTSAQQSWRLLEYSLGSEFIDPLGQPYAVTPMVGLQQSDADWPHEDMLIRTGRDHGSLYCVTSVPEQYEFPFLAWLRSLDIAFTLTPDTLRSRVEIRVKTPPLDFTELAALKSTSRLDQHGRPRSVRQTQQSGPKLLSDNGRDPETRRYETRRRPIVPTPDIPSSARRTSTRVKRSPEELETLEEPGVLGVSVHRDLKVATVDPETPAARCGLQVGDRIIAIDNDYVETHAELVRRLKEGSSTGHRIRILVIRNGELQELTADVSGGRRA